MIHCSVARPEGMVVLYVQQPSAAEHSRNPGWRTWYVDAQTNTKPYPTQPNHRAARQSINRNQFPVGLTPPPTAPADLEWGPTRLSCGTGSHTLRSNNTVPGRSFAVLDSTPLGLIQEQLSCLLFLSVSFVVVVVKDSVGYDWRVCTSSDCTIPLSFCRTPVVTQCLRWSRYS